MKVFFFQLDGCGHSQDNATPSIFPDSKNSTIELSNEVSYVSEIFWKGGPKHMATPVVVVNYGFPSILWQMSPNLWQNDLSSSKFWIPLNFMANVPKIMAK